MADLQQVDLEPTICGPEVRNLRLKPALDTRSLCLGRLLGLVHLALQATPALLVLDS